MLQELLCQAESERRWLIAVAAPREAEAVCAAFDVPGSEAPASWQAVPLSPQFDLLVTGVGKANAAAGLACTFDSARHCGVLNLGVAGALPGSGLAIGDVVLATASVYADEGIIEPHLFTNVAAMGFPPNAGLGQPPTVAFEADTRLLRLIEPHVTVCGVIATVSTCSGTDDAAQTIVKRTSALAEAMEGAALGFTLRRLDRSGLIPFVEVRVISNSTGNRNRQEWDLAGALRRLTALCRAR